MLLCATRLGGKGSRLPPPGDGGNYRFSVAAKVGFLWTPPFRQGKTLGSLLRVVGCCHLSGLRCGRNTAAGLYGSSRTGSRSPEACSKHSGKPWLSQPRLADCCAKLSFRSPLRPCDRGQPTPPLLNHGTRPNDQQAPGRPFTAFRNGTEFFLATGRFETLVAPVEDLQSSLPDS